MEQRKGLDAVRRGCTNRDVRKVLVAALKGGCRYRLTKHGIILHGENGHSATAHFTTSDVRAAKNLTRDLTRAGLIEKGTP